MPRALARGPAGPPPKVRAIEPAFFSHGIAPGEVADADLPGCFADAGPAVPEPENSL